MLHFSSLCLLFNRSSTSIHVIGQLALLISKYSCGAVNQAMCLSETFCVDSQVAMSLRQCWCAGRQFVQATGKQRPPLGASPRPAALAAAAKPPSVPNTPPIAAGPLPTTALLASSQVQGRAVLNHPLQVAPPAISLTAAPCTSVACSVSAATLAATYLTA